MILKLFSWPALRMIVRISRLRNAKHAYADGPVSLVLIVRGECKDAKL
jgi:hypothetical protein